MPHSQPSQRACSVATTSAVWSSEKDCSASGAAAAMKTAAATPRIMTRPAPSRLLHQQPRSHETTKKTSLFVVGQFEATAELAEPAEPAEIWFLSDLPALRGCFSGRM